MGTTLKWRLQAFGHRNMQLEGVIMMNKKIHKFWDFLSESETERTLRIDGVIAEESWLDDDVTPKMFKSELEEGSGNITLWLNFPGGCVFAASQIYNMLRDYEGKVTVKVDGIAASAASVVAMAGDEVLMSPVSLMMIHDPSTVAIGDTEEMQKAISMLAEIKEAIINAYHSKSGLSRKKIADMMTAETWINSKKAVELGFADKILFDDDDQEDESESLIFSRAAVTNKVLEKLKPKQKAQNSKPENLVKQNIEPLYQRLNLLQRG
jgi:ATP-dependent Clp protease protease subunit